MKTFEEINKLTKKEYLKLSELINGKSLNDFLLLIKGSEDFSIITEECDYININGNCGAYTINKNIDGFASVIELSKWVDVIDDESGYYACGQFIDEL